MKTNMTNAPRIDTKESLRSLQKSLSSFKSRFQFTQSLTLIYLMLVGPRGLTCSATRVLRSASFTTGERKQTNRPDNKHSSRSSDSPNKLNGIILHNLVSQR